METRSDTRAGTQREIVDPLFRKDWEIDLRAANRAEKTISLYGDTLGQFEAFLREMGMPLVPASLTCKRLAGPRRR